MQSNHLAYMGIMLLSGLLIPVMAALNAGAGAKIGNPLFAGFAMAATGAAGAGLFMIVLKIIQGEEFVLNLSALGTPLVFLAGCIMAFYLLTITAIAPRIGVGTAVFFVLLGQLTAAAIIDHFGLFGATKSPITWTRGAGLALMALGVFLARKV